MKPTRTIWSSVIGLVFVLLVSGAASQKGTKAKQGSARATKVKRVNAPVYKPPRRGTPRGRVGGGTRGPGDERPVILLLVPDHTGLTVQQTPDLFWYISSLPHHPIEFTINDEHSIKPVLVTSLELPERPGIQRIRLRDYNLRLKPAIEYQWFVALVVDPNSRSKDIIGGGWLERTERTDTLQHKLTGAKKTELPFIYAEAGIWYDALQAVSDLIDASPDNLVFRQQRAALLDQVGLAEIGEPDRGNAP